MVQNGITINQLIYRKLGPDTGVDCINNYAPSAQLADFLNALAEPDTLPKTIIYSLNPNDNAAIGTILGCFQNADTVGKRYSRAAPRWFNDHKQGMTEQMVSPGQSGAFGQFHGYADRFRGAFCPIHAMNISRRILCNLIGGWVENGNIPMMRKRWAD